MPKIQIINPLPGGMRFTSPDRAEHFCHLGMATMSQDGKLLFKESNQIGMSRILSEDEEFKRNRSGVVYWNGARYRVVDNKDLSMFPPCCNVVFPKVGTRRAARRYAA
jgi:hypothetical protein